MAVMRQRELSTVIKLNYGSLYSVIEALQREGLVVPQETLRQGRHPERTIYTTTSLAMLEAKLTWMQQLIREINDGQLRWKIHHPDLSHMQIENETEHNETDNESN